MSRDILGCKKVLLEALLNSNSHGNGHADHGIVACAQEASEARFREGKSPKNTISSNI